MTDEEIHNVYLHMSGKAEGLVEATGKADFPVLFARAILEYEGLTKDAQNMASKSTYKEQLDCVGWFGYDTGLRLWFETNKGDDGAIPLYKDQQQRTWVGLKDDEIWKTISRIGTSDSDVNPYAKLADARAIEALLKEKNNG